MNRPVTPQHVNEMVKSVQKWDVIRPVVVTKADFLDNTSSMYILDGQHLYHALMKLGLEIPVKRVVIKDMIELIQCIAELNNTSRSWGLNDYVHVWAGLPNKPDYRKLQKLHKEHGYTYSTMLLACNPHTMNHVSSRLKEGKFRIPDLHLTETILKNLQSIFKTFPKGFRQEVSVLVQSYISFFVKTKSYSHTRMTDAIRVNQSILTSKLHSRAECEEFLTDIYKAGTAKHGTRIAVPVTAGSMKRGASLQDK